MFLFCFATTDSKRDNRSEYIETLRLSKSK
jgi:hypothetical protein